MDKTNQHESGKESAKGVAHQSFLASDTLRALPSPPLRFSSSSHSSEPIQRAPQPYPDMEGWWKSNIEGVEEYMGQSAKEVILWELDEFGGNRDLIPDQYLESIAPFYQTEGGDDKDIQIREMIWTVLRVRVGGEIEEEEEEAAVAPAVANDDLDGMMDDLFADPDEEELAAAEARDNLAFFLGKVRTLADPSITSFHIDGLRMVWERGDQAQRDRMTAIFSDNEELATLSSLEYVLEAINPLHVGYATGVQLFESWWEFINSPLVDDAYKGESYADFVQRRAPEVRASDPSKYEEVDSYTAAERVQYEVQFAGKNLIKADGEALVGDNIYVLSPAETFYSKEKEGTMHHSSFLQGAPVICAGHFFTDSSGKLTKINNSSGHYAPDNQQLKRALVILQGKMDTSEVMVGVHSGPDVPIDTFLATN